ncbi:hypothetical protein [Phenylobacterium sp.]|uniref:hypothetical protein n=1 Tax=Phenylobacterium sp. TaxID=1871053 RepID=UPI00121DA44D|nr:hypothetical protein [Phenylobacterium sp.]THD67107.1 MAG: hypothetical protein E8A12_05390 [Phenylobacterium sp.]
MMGTTGAGSRAWGRSAAAVLATGILVLAGVAAARPRPPGGDLEGLWTNVTVTPIERPAAFDGPTTTEARAKAYEASNPQAFGAADIDAVGGRQSEWWEYGGPMIRVDGKIHTAMVVEPADGKLPYTAAGRTQMESSLKSRIAGLDNPEDRPSTERCLMGGSSSSSVPMMPHWDNSLYQIVQTRDFVTIRMESGRDPRIIRLNAAAHLPPAIRPWAGDSIAHWEGRSLVVETTNLNPGEAFKSPQPLYISKDAKVTERFTRVSAGEIVYDFAVDDPAIYSRPWRGQLIFHAAKGPLFEFACHEGNYSLPGVLAGARHDEAAVK